MFWLISDSATNFSPPQYNEANGYRNIIPRKVLFHFSNNFWVFGSTQAAKAIGAEIAKTGMMPARNTKAIRPAIKPNMAGTMNTNNSNSPTFGSISDIACPAAVAPAPIAATAIPVVAISVMIVAQPTSLYCTFGARSDIKSYRVEPRIFAMSVIICIRKYDIFMATAAIINRGSIFFMP